MCTSFTSDSDHMKTSPSPAAGRRTLHIRRQECFQDVKQRANRIERNWCSLFRQQKVWGRNYMSKMKSLPLPVHVCVHLILWLEPILTMKIKKWKEKTEFFALFSLAVCSNFGYNSVYNIFCQCRCRSMSSCYICEGKTNICIYWLLWSMWCYCVGEFTIVQWQQQQQQPE